MVVATGFFDGVHLGHRHVLSSLVSVAKERGEESTVVTFWPHPRTVLQKDARTFRLLSSLAEKSQLLKSIGVDHVEVLDFTKEFGALTTEEYLRDYIIGKFGGTAILLGYDNRIGSDSTTPEEVALIAERLGLDVIRTDSITTEGITVSSTKIRALIAEGNIEAASQMLGYHYSLLGVVVSGNRKGRLLGFPTANMQLYEPLKLIPGSGVYLVEVETLGNKYAGMCNIGYRPTMTDDRTMTIETNIFDFDEDIYGLDIKIKFVRRIRQEVKFASPDALKAQLAVDRQECLSIAKEEGLV